MYAKEAEHVMQRLNQVLAKPIQTRCAELAVMIDRISPADLQSIFPILIDHIFGPQSTFNWGLRTTSSAVNEQDFQAMRYFLSPTGPFFKLIYILLRDPLVNYDFNVMYLPTKVRQGLETTVPQLFYEELLHKNPQTQQIMSLLLNPFDYYFFHFAYHLINPWHQRSGVPFGASWNTVYYNLCCDYVIHFLPTEVNHPVMPLIDFYCGKGALDTLPSFKRPVRHSGLIRYTAPEMPNLPKQTFESHPRADIWRSETVLVAFTDMWFNNDQVIDFGQGSNSMPSRMLQFNELPTGEYIRIVRVLVKQLHAFSASARADDTHMLQLRKVATPMMQGKVYIFLRNLVNRWPLDGSFRLVLELWLSFIQPWRYQGPTYLKTVADPNPDIEDTSTAPMKCVEGEHVQFIAENLLAYVVIFQQLILRFCRVDLASPKMSLMLFRLTKVFSQPNLVTYLREIERSLSLEKFNQTASSMYQSSLREDTGNNSTNDSFMLDQSNADPSFHYSNRWNMIIKQKIYEMEGPTFFYQYLFATPPSKEIYELIKYIKKAKAAAESIVQWRIEEEAKQTSGFFGSIRSFLMLVDNSNDEFTLDERKRVPQHLEFSLIYLKEIFQIVELDHVGSTEQMLNSPSPSRNLSMSDDVRLLTPERVRERIKHMKYEGNPDLMPITSYENGFLVTFLYDLSRKVNEKYGPVMQRWYYQNDYFGRLTQQVLSPPMTAYTYDKSSGRSVRKAIYLPPRLSLRPLANHKFLFYTILGAAVANLLGYDTLTFIFISFLLWFLFICLKATRKTGYNETRNVTSETRRQLYSANDSF